MRMMCEGQTIAVIAKQMGVTEKTIWTWAQRPDFRAELDRIQAESIEAARVILRAGAAAAAAELMRAASGQHGGVDETGRRYGADHAQVKAATELLDRVGVTSTHLVEVTHHGDLASLSDDELDERLRALLPSIQVPAPN